MPITDKTTLAELQELGATTLSDIPLTELLEYIRHTCLQAAADTEADKGMGWAKDFIDASLQVQAAIESVDRALTRA